MSTVVRDSLRGGLFVGRHAESARLRSLLDGGTSQVLFVHGVSGSGKSALLRHFAGHVAPSASSVLVLDGQQIEPTERGFVATLGAAAGQRDELDDLTGLLARLGDRGVPVVVCLDQYEVLRLLDTWLRQVFVPLLPGSVRLLIAGREEPNAAWARLPTGTFEALRLGPLSASDSRALLSVLGVDAAATQVIMRFAGGHPLTLLLGALAAKEQPARAVRDVTMCRLLDEFARIYLDDLTPETRELLEAAAVVRRVTRPLLGALLPHIDASQGFLALSDLPFVDTTADGLAVHESVRQAVATELRAAEPSRHRLLRRRAWTHLRRELRDAPRPELWRHTADMIYLIENRNVHEAHFPSGAHAYAVEPATMVDRDAIDAIIERHEPPAAADQLRSWWRRSPDAFRVARDPAGVVAGFSIMTTSARVDPRTFARDPVVAGWLDHLERNPIPASQVLLLMRRWLTWDVGDGPCEAQAALWLDLKRTYMQLRPRLRRNYGTTTMPHVYAPVLEPIGGGAIPDGAVEIDGVDYHGVYVDFGPSSVDGWLTRIAGDELGLAQDDLLDVGQRQLLIDKHRVDLTPLEFEVLHYLREHTGSAVSRHALLADIWGYDTDIGSNVVDAVIRGLRKKLGRNAAMIETVRGLGYRLRQSSTP